MWYVAFVLSIIQVETETKFYTSECRVSEVHTVSDSNTQFKDV